MNRLYVAECVPTLTGAKADHRLPVRASLMEALARAVAAALGLRGATTTTTALPAKLQAWAQAVARDLQAHAGQSAVLAGDAEPAVVHAIVHFINESLGNVGNAVLPVAAVEAATR
jgi:molybdopterin-containing oxidoreductase family iron-sulfur binding subunit